MSPYKPYKKNDKKKDFGSRDFGNRDFGNRDFGDREPRSGGFNRGERGEMHKATCGNCGVPCEVPFIPRGGRPVLCNNCFKKDGPASSSRFGGDRDNFPRERSSFSQDRPTSAPRDVESNSKQLSQINQKLDKILGILDDLMSEVEDDEDEE